MNHCFSEYPYLSVKVKVASQKSDEEHFHLALCGNLVQITAASPGAAAFAKAQTLAGLQANRLGDIVGNNAPQFRIRPLWLDSLEGVTSSIVIDLGYNTLIVAYDLCQQAQEIRTGGIRLAICCSSIDECKKLQGMCDYVVWQEGTVKMPCPKKDPTPLERAEYELQFLQKECPLPVFYYTNLKSAIRLVGKSSIIMFDAFVDDRISLVCTDVARLAVEETFGLLPLLTLSEIAIGEGQVFTDFPMAEIEHVLGRKRYIGAGVRTGVYTAQMPLWVVGQRMWRALSVNSIFEFWLDRYHPDWSAWLTPAVLHHIHMLFIYKDTEQVEKASLCLLQFAEVLSQYKTALKFQKTTKSLEELSSLLFWLQQGFKCHFEELCVKKMRKTPLAMQNFTPIAFLPLQKSVANIK